METDTNETTVHCAAGCTHAAYFDHNDRKEITSALQFAGWRNGVFAECAAMGLGPVDRIESARRVAEEVMAGRT